VSSAGFGVTTSLPAVSRPEFGDDVRQLRGNDENPRAPVTWLSAVPHYGLGRSPFLGLPTRWLAFPAPVHRFDIVDATVVGMAFVPLVVAAGRIGLLRPGLGRVGVWRPSLGGTTSGVVDSFRVCLSRSVLLDATSMWVAYGTVWLSSRAEPFTSFEVPAAVAVALPSPLLEAVTSVASPSMSGSTATTCSNVGVEYPGVSER